MNFLNDRKGSWGCERYGNSFFVLKKGSIRSRCTIAHTRKYAPGEIVATLGYCFEVLSLFEKTELKALYHASQGHEYDSEGYAFIKEVQIHGPIRFDRDIERVYAPEHDIKARADLVRQFEEKFKVPVLPIEYLQKGKE
jgi:hypothetical protein